MAAKLKKGDKVVVLAGKDKGKQGEITAVFPKENKAVVDGINIAIRHTRQSQTSQGGRVAKAMPIDLSNLALLVPGVPGPATSTGTVRQEPGGLILDIAATAPGGTRAQVAGRLATDGGVDRLLAEQRQVAPFQAQVSGVDVLLLDLWQHVTGEDGAERAAKVGVLDHHQWGVDVSQGVGILGVTTGQAVGVTALHRRDVALVVASRPCATGLARSRGGGVSRVGTTLGTVRGDEHPHHGQGDEQDGDDDGHRHPARLGLGMVA